MRRLTAATAAAWLAVPLVGAVLGLAAAPAAAQDATDPPASEAPEGSEAPEAVPGEEQCSINDPRLIELSGLVAIEDGYIAVNDSTDIAERQPIFVLDQDCQVADEIAFPSLPRDPEDLELDREANVLWVADTGDNAAGGGEGEVRPSVALWRVELDGDRVPVIYRFTFPDGEPRDAEALVLNGDGTPVIVTKNSPAELFAPEELTPSTAPDDTVELTGLGEFAPPETETDNPLGAAGGEVVTGGANSPDGQNVVLRTYADAFEFEVAEGDVAGAITEGEPIATPLPDEPQGEAITYSANGERFLTVSEAPEGDNEFTPTMLGYTPGEPAPPPEEAAQEPGGSGGGGGGFFNDLQDIINLIAIVGVIGLLLVAAGVFGIVRARRRGSGPPAGAGGDGPDGDAPVTGRARLTGFPGESPPGWEAEQPAGQAGMYASGATAQMPGTEYGGQEYYQQGGEYQEYGYGGQQYDGQQYGGQQYGGQQYGGQQYGGQQYGAPEHGYTGTTYGRGGGYPDQQPYDQEWPNGYRDQGQQGGGQHGGGQQGGGTYQSGGGNYQAGTYQSGGAHQPGAPDYYSDDPDYPYEFRERDRW